ncbi:MAG: hypothetical protein HRU33_18090 [Rhodobacteraceae bacterium]|nr:hypothetical protein [Paracoccaceae bacterium]
MLQPFSAGDFSGNEDVEKTDDERHDAWAVALQAQFSEVSKYREYVLELSPYGTHQGVKGLEIPRVMALADDGSTRFKGLASYEKLLGTKPASKEDLKKMQEGKETTFERTRRLLYVTCTRAEESLALVVYSENPQAGSDYIVDKEWVSLDEVVLLKQE